VVVDVSAGLAHAAHARISARWCWGSNYYGQIGDGTQLDSGTPVTSWGAIAQVAVAGHTCAMTCRKSGAGTQRRRALGDGTTLTADGVAVLAVRQRGDHLARQ
jgi:hypothetical protein